MPEFSLAFRFESNRPVEACFTPAARPRLETGTDAGLDLPRGRARRLGPGRQGHRPPLPRRRHQGRQGGHGRCVEDGRLPEALTPRWSDSDSDSDSDPGPESGPVWARLLACYVELSSYCLLTRKDSEQHFSTVYSCCIMSRPAK